MAANTRSKQDLGGEDLVLGGRGRVGLGAVEEVLVEGNRPAVDERVRLHPAAVRAITARSAGRRRRTGRS
jgi:hypothetical protein